MERHYHKTGTENGGWTKDHRITTGINMHKPKNHSYIFNISINTNCLVVPNVQRSTDKKQLNTYTVVEPDLWPKPSATRAWRWKPACASSLRSASVPKLFMKVSLSSLSCENFCPSSVDVAQDWNKRSKMLAKECKPPTAAVNFSPIGGTAKISSMSLHASA